MTMFANTITGEVITDIEMVTLHNGEEFVSYTDIHGEREFVFVEVFDKNFVELRFRKPELTLEEQIAASARELDEMLKAIEDGYCSTCDARDGCNHCV